MAGLIPRRYHPHHYKMLMREEDDTGRRYVLPDDSRVWSVTTILEATKSEESKRKLAAWAAREGEENAKRIKEEAAIVGTAVHRVAERLFAQEDLPPPASWLEALGYEMGYRLVNKYFPNFSELWGSEVSLYEPGRYAGTTDIVGIYRGNPAIVDLKQSLRPKRYEWIEDYFHQLAAYALAHDFLHGTKINHGYVLIACQNGETQEFSTAGAEFDRYKAGWMARVSRAVSPASGAALLPSP